MHIAPLRTARHVLCVFNSLCTRTQYHFSCVSSGIVCMQVREVEYEAIVCGLPSAIATRIWCVSLSISRFALRVPP